MNVYVENPYKTDCHDEHMYIAVPFPKGMCNTCDEYILTDDSSPLKTQSKVTATWDDGSVKWALYRFTCDLKRFASKTLTLEKGVLSYDGIKTSKTQDGYGVDTGAISYTLSTGSHIFDRIDFGDIHLSADDITGPILTTTDDSCYDTCIDSWTIIESGPLYCRLRGDGRLMYEDTTLHFELYIDAYLGKSYIDIGYRIINTQDKELAIKSLIFSIHMNGKSEVPDFIAPPKQHDSTGCGDITFDLEPQEGPVYHMMGLSDIAEFNRKLGELNLRTLIGMSNYRTEFYARNDGGSLMQYATSDLILKEANEQFTEVLYGTFFADRTDKCGGICATVYQAQQNFPKAVSASADSIFVHIVPDCEDKVVMQPGMSRLQSMRLFFHDATTPIEVIDDQSLRYQIPCHPHLDPEDIKKAHVVTDVFVEEKKADVEISLIGKADNHSRAFGMLNFGDSPDLGYTKQGRGGGDVVWTNNEYDFPHACALMYMRTSTRRFFDYMCAAVGHWMDVDICHYSKDPLRIGGQWEHTNGHCKGGIMVCSHEWVEGLLDYYHLTGDERAYNCAIGIGHNVLKLLETPMFKHSGEANARETGWALRTLVALNIETHDPSWLVKCDWIVGHFKEWEDEYGHWLSPYTDNISIRVPFMISIAVGSLSRYYDICHREDIKFMILRAVDDMIDNCILDNGLFYYKGIDSLTRNGNNPLPLEALAIAYDLTGDAKYLRYGLPTFKMNQGGAIGGIGDKMKREDAVITTGPGTKGFAQAFLPIVRFYKAASEEKLL